MCQSLFGRPQSYALKTLQRSTDAATVVYDSSFWIDLEHSNVEDTVALGKEYLDKNPALKADASGAQGDDDADGAAGDEGIVRGYSYLPETPSQSELQVS